MEQIERWTGYSPVSALERELTGIQLLLENITAAMQAFDGELYRQKFRAMSFRLVSCFHISGDVIQGLRMQNKATIQMSLMYIKEIVSILSKMHHAVAQSGYVRECHYYTVAQTVFHVSAQTAVSVSQDIAVHIPGMVLIEMIRSAITYDHHTAQAYIRKSMRYYLPILHKRLFHHVHSANIYVLLNALLIQVCGALYTAPQLIQLTYHPLAMVNVNMTSDRGSLLGASGLFSRCPPQFIKMIFEVLALNEKLKFARCCRMLFNAYRQHAVHDTEKFKANYGDDLIRYEQLVEAMNRIQQNVH